MITMTPTGQVKRENLRGPLARAGLVADALIRPYAKGFLVISHGRRASGGGIYTFSGKEGAPVQRVWCVAGGQDNDRACKIEEHALSPDGCKLAFFAKGSDSLPLRPEHFSISLKILDLCQAPAR